MMSATRVFLQSTTRGSRCHCSSSSVTRYSTKNSPLLLAPSSTQYYYNSMKRQFIKSIRFVHSSKSNQRSSSKHSNNNNFLTPGFQPTAITGDNIGFYHGSTFYDGAPPNVLPILNASPILSPGKYVRQSSWSSASHQYNNKKGTKGGTDAARRLVDARREFMCLMNKELLGGSQQHSASGNQNHNKKSEGVVVADVRKIYVLTGHGVPTELLSHLIQVVRGWTITSSTTQKQHSSSSVVQFSFQNVHNSTLLNRDEIQVIHANGTTSKLFDTTSNNHSLLSTNNNGDDWEHDFELYMVVMDRIASRLASFVLLQPRSDMSTTTLAVDDHNNNEAILGSSGSVITPASLKRWNVTMMKGEALPLSLLPMDRHHYKSCGKDIPDGGNSTRRREGGKQPQSPIILTVEWVMNNKGSNDCCNIILRLQDDGSLVSGLDDERSRDDPISLVFDGVYE